MRRAWKATGVRNVGWDHAAFHKAKTIAEVGLRRTYQPSYLPELHPAERMLEEVRRWVEGRRYDGIEANQAAVKGRCEDWSPSERADRSWGGTISVKLSMGCSYYFCPHGSILPSE